MPLQFNTIHYLPKSKFPVSELPVQVFVNRYISYERKIERRDLKENQERLVDPVLLKLERKAKSQGLVLLPEFNF